MNKITECETAFAYCQYGGSNNFLLHGFNRWGWSIGPIPNGEIYTRYLFAGAGGSDTAKGTIVGEIVMNFPSSGVSTITYNIYEEYSLSEIHIYVGADMFPKSKKGVPTVAPGQYNFVISNPVSGFAYPVGTDLPNGQYMIAHAVICNERD